MTKYDHLLLTIKNKLSTGVNESALDIIQTISVIRGVDEEDDYDWMIFIMSIYVLYVNKIPIETEMTDLVEHIPEIMDICEKIRTLKYEFKNMSMQQSTLPATPFEA